MLKFGIPDMIPENDVLLVIDPLRKKMYVFMYSYIYVYL